MSQNLGASQDFQVGDELHLVEIDYTGLDDESRAALEYIKTRKRPVKVYEIDEDGCPWVEFRMRSKDGILEHHFVSVHFDKWSKVKKRK